jgi:hypothetical protein
VLKALLPATETFTGTIEGNLEEFKGKLGDMASLSLAEGVVKLTGLDVSKSALFAGLAQAGAPEFPKAPAPADTEMDLTFEAKGKKIGMGLSLKTGPTKWRGFMTASTDGAIAMVLANEAGDVLLTVDGTLAKPLARKVDPKKWKGRLEEFRLMHSDLELPFSK